MASRSPNSLPGSSCSMAMPAQNAGAAILFVLQPIQASRSSPRKSSWESKKRSLCKAMRFLVKIHYGADWVLQASKLTKQRSRKQRITSPWLEASSQRCLMGMYDLSGLYGDMSCRHRACTEDCGYAPPPGDGRERFPTEVTSLFNNIERNSNPWEISNDKRAEWAAGLDVPLMSENPDADVLYWVGCMGSFDERNKKVATAVAKILKAAHVNFAILGPEEACTGDPARRIGNEYLWQMMAQQNIETLDGYGFNRSQRSSTGTMAMLRAMASGTVAKHRTVLTACPHCFNTIKNEYPQLGGDYEVVHHTRFIDSLLANQTITLPEGFDQRKLTYHDPCYIGRYNDVYDEPRQVLKVLNSNGVTEMRRNRNKSFCCGGGGGRAWMEEKIGKRVNQARVNEALDTGAEVLAAACPFCITMFDDGIKGVEAEEKMQIEDIAEIVVQAIEARKEIQTR